MKKKYYTTSFTNSWSQKQLAPIKSIMKSINKFQFKKIDNSPCANSPCLNGGYCNVNQQTCSYTCQCQTGFTGPTCATSNKKKLL